MDTAGGGDALYQHGIDGHTDHNEKSLKSKREQGFEIIVAHLPPFPIYHRSQRNRCDGHREVDFQQPSEDDEEDADRNGLQA